MKLGNTLTVVIPLVIVGYAAWLIWRMIRDRRRGKCALGACSGCPLREGCRIAKKINTDEKRQNGDKGHG